MPVEIRELVIRTTVVEQPHPDVRHNGEGVLSPEMVDRIVKEVLDRIHEMERSRKER